jgi:hypothetical protein
MDDPRQKMFGRPQAVEETVERGAVLGEVNPAPEQANAILR